MKPSFLEEHQLILGDQKCLEGEKVVSFEFEELALGLELEEVEDLVVEFLQEI
jgi:hypothetical protein